MHASNPAFMAISPETRTLAIAERRAKIQRIEKLGAAAKHALHRIFVASEADPAVDAWVEYAAGEYRDEIAAFEKMPDFVPPPNYNYGMPMPSPFDLTKRLEDAERRRDELREQLDQLDAAASAVEKDGVPGVANMIRGGMRPLVKSQLDGVEQEISLLLNSGGGVTGDSPATIIPADGADCIHCYGKGRRYNSGVVEEVECPFCKGSGLAVAKASESEGTGVAATEVSEVAGLSAPE